MRTSPTPSTTRHPLSSEGGCSAKMVRKGPARLESPGLWTNKRVEVSAMGNDTRCTIEGCEGTALSRGWCKLHYRRWQRHGDPYKTLMPTRSVGSIEERFWPKVDASGDCWEWIGAKNDQGYGIFYINRKPVRAHRFSYRTLVGEIPDGLQLDHLCRNRPCVNPDHLEPVTSAENTRRGVLFHVLSERARMRTYCKNNHELTENNIYNRKGSNTRACNICRKDATARYRKRMNDA